MDSPLYIKRGYILNNFTNSIESKFGLTMDLRTFLGMQDINPHETLNSTNQITLATMHF